MSSTREPKSPDGRLSYKSTDFICACSFGVLGNADYQVNQGWAMYAGQYMLGDGLIWPRR